MASINRLDQIVSHIEEHGFLSVTELSRLLDVSEMTIRRDLALLDEQKRLQRVYGGAAAIQRANGAGELDDNGLPNRPVNSLVEGVDVLIATSVNPTYDGALVERIANKNIPMVAESQSIRDEVTLVAVDNYQAGYELGVKAGKYAQEHFEGKAYALDLTTRLPNSTARSRGFQAGLRYALPPAEILVSVDAQSHGETAYQLTLDALTVHNHINLIFAINDSLAFGAIRACKEMNIPPERMVIIPFGLEGDTMKDLLVGEPSYVKFGLAMFPEIVGPCCIEACIASYNRLPLPRQLLTPHVILAPQTLEDFYTKTLEGWRIRWDQVCERLSIPIDINPDHWPDGTTFPRRIGFIIPFREHEWYQNLVRTMRNHVRKYRIDFEIVDVEQNLKAEVEERRKLIARLAGEQADADEVILVDGGPIAVYLADVLAERSGLTIITNSIPVFDVLKRNPENTLILTGGAYRSSSKVLVGPPAEGSLRELRADKLFLTVTGISLNFGLSHTNISEVTIKQAMIRSSREVILIADTTDFNKELMVQVAPLNVVHKLITDDALPASTRLDLNKLGIRLLIATGQRE